jgi:hypothetical protein
MGKLVNYLMCKCTNVLMCKLVNPDRSLRCGIPCGRLGTIHLKNCVIFDVFLRKRVMYGVGI